MLPKLSDLTSVDAVIEAIHECDRLGRVPFLKAYGYKRSRLYLLKYNDQTYDSKAIVGVAYGKQHGQPLLSRQFSGGVATVIPVLRKLGFDVIEPEHPAIALAVGTAYMRKDLVESYGGQLQAGIWTPKEFPAVFIFSGDSGSAFGYTDGWTGEGVFKYSGEGQEGDMTFTGGNRAIRDHQENGKELLLFEDLGKGKGVRYEGCFECAAWEVITGPDKYESYERSSRKDAQVRSIQTFGLTRNHMNPLPIFELQDVFVLSGFPRYTFVPPVEYTRLLVALRTPGRSIVVEGPSGIGKTTAVVNAISEAGISERVLSLSARKVDDIQIIHELPGQLPFGTVLIDDFHRLDEPAKHAIADLMKTLADEGAAHSKLIVLGITNAGQSLISFGKDLANRIEVIPFEANPEYKVEELLKKGEQALNISINVSADIAWIRKAVSTLLKCSPTIRAYGRKS